MNSELVDSSRTCHHVPLSGSPEWRSMEEMACCSCVCVPDQHSSPITAPSRVFGSSREVRFALEDVSSFGVISVVSVRSWTMQRTSAALSALHRSSLGLRA